MEYIRRDALVNAIQFTRSNWKEVLDFTHGYARSLCIPKCINGVATCELSDPIDSNHWIVQEGDYIVLLDEFKPGVPHFMVSPKKYFNSVYREIGVNDDESTN